MPQEFTIKSQQIEDKINQLLPSQGGFQPGVDFSASTMVIPIVDLTETAEGSSLRQDLQTAASLNSEVYSVNNTTTTIINTTGYYQILNTFTGIPDAAAGKEGTINITDGITTKALYKLRLPATSNSTAITDTKTIIIFVQAGESITIAADNTVIMSGSARQIADINGNLVNP
jgi:hypothetical protein